MILDDPIFECIDLFYCYILLLGWSLNHYIISFLVSYTVCFSHVHAWYDIVSIQDMSFEWNTQSITAKVISGNYVLISHLLIVSSLEKNYVLKYPILCVQYEHMYSVAMEYKSFR